MKKILLAAAILITTAIIIYAAAISHPEVHDECREEWEQKRYYPYPLKINEERNIQPSGKTIHSLLSTIHP